MAEHYLFMGGPGPNGGVAPGTYNAQMFPAKLPGSNDDLGIDARRGGKPDFLVQRRLVWKGHTGPKYTSDPVSPGLYSYLQQNPIVVGDRLWIILLPKESELVRVWWRVKTPLPGFDFDLEADSDVAGGTVLTLTAAPVNAATAATGLIDVQAQNGGTPFYTQTNGIIRLNVNNLPAAGIGGSEVYVSALIRKFDIGGGN
jgi:hypothetical protein